MKEQLNYFLDIIEGDLETLGSIALGIAEEEKDLIVKNGKWVYPGTYLPPLKSFSIVSLKPRCTIPIAMVCFSAIDRLGKIMSALHDISELECGAGSFKSHSTTFFKVLAKRDDLKNAETATMFQDAYRHSIMHGFFPATSTSVGYAITYEPQIDNKSLIISVSGGRLLNVVYLLEVTKIGLSSFRKLISGPTSNEILEVYIKIIEKEQSKLSS